MSLFQPRLLAQYLISADFFHGAVTTFSLSIASLAAGMAVVLLLAIGQEVPLRAVRALVVFYLWLFRGTPVLLQLVFAFVNAPLFATFLLGMFWKRTTGHGAFFVGERIELRAEFGSDLEFGLGGCGGSERKHRGQPAKRTQCGHGCGHSWGDYIGLGRAVAGQTGGSNWQPGKPAT